MFERVVKAAQLIQAAGMLKPGSAVRLTGLWGSAGALVAAAVGRIAARPILFVAQHLDDADNAADDIEVFTHRPGHLFPAWEVDIGTDHINDEVAGERLRLCNLLAADADDQPEKAELIVAPVMALLQPVPSRGALAASRLALRVGDDLAPEFLTSWLLDAQFERVDQVDQQGQFASRGGIVDAFPAGQAEAVRIEFFGDRIASLRRFDLDTQRSCAPVDRFDLTGTAVARQSDPAAMATLLSYLPDDAIVCLHEPARLAELADQIYGRLTDDQGKQPVGGHSPPPVSP